MNEQRTLNTAENGMEPVETSSDVSEQLLPIDYRATKKDHYRFAVVGSGRISAHTHVPTLLASPRVELVALVDPVVEYAEALRNRYRLNVAVAKSLDEILDQIDAAVIATPNHTHRDLAVQCLDHGIPVLIEKPLSFGLSDGLEIVRASRRSGLPVAVGYQTRFLPQAEILREVIQDEVFGPVKRFAYQFGSLGGWAPLSGYNLNRDTAGGGVMTGNGSHFMDRLISWFGYPDMIGLQDDSEGGPESNALASFSFSRHQSDRPPIRGTARFSRTVQLPPGLVLETETGFVVASDGRETPVSWCPRDRPEWQHDIQRDDLALTGGKIESDYLLDDFLDAVADGRPPRVDAVAGLQSSRLLEALYKNRSPMNQDWQQPLYRSMP